MRVAIVGAGGVGGYFGGRLCQNPNVQVHFLVRPSSSNVAAIRTNGLRLLSVKGDCHLPATTCHVATSAADIGPCDYVLVTVKTYDLEELAPTLKPLIHEGTAIVPLLNGMEAPDVLSRALGKEHVLGGLCLIIAFIESPGVIRHTAGSDTQLITFGELSGRCESARVARLKHAFLQVGVPAHVPPDDIGVTACLWEKFVKIVSFSGATAVCRAGLGAIMEQPRSRFIFEQLQAEGLAVARAYGGDGLMSAPDWLEKRLKESEKLPRNSTASMQRDLVAGRVSELHEQVGTMVRYAEAKGISTPVTSVVYAALLPQEAEARANAAASKESTAIKPPGQPKDASEAAGPLPRLFLLSHPGPTAVVLGASLLVAAMVAVVVAPRVKRAT